MGYLCQIAKTKEKKGLEITPKNISRTQDSAMLSLSQSLEVQQMKSLCTKLKLLHWKPHLPS